jgi:hypothetical protein
MKAKLHSIPNSIKLPRKLKKKAKLFLKKQQEKATGCKVKIKLIYANSKGIFTYYQRTYLNKKIKIKK